VDIAEKRKARRFDLKLPFELLRDGSDSTLVGGETCNVSSRGVLFHAQTDLPLGEPIEYMITLPSGIREGISVRLRCVGKVVRTETPRNTVSNHIAVAATLERYEFLRK
jgi:hypothetical protein